MMNQNSLKEMADDIRRIHGSDAVQAERLVETYLRENLKSFPAEKRLDLLRQISNQFREEDVSASDETNQIDTTISNLFSRLLGTDVSGSGSSSEELLQQLAESLNTIFDTLNAIVGVINRTLFGRPDAGETIRTLIDTQLTERNRLSMIEDYLEQIKKAFLISQEAFKKAAQKKVSQVLRELDPDRIQARNKGIWKIGPLLKADRFEAYSERHLVCKQWFESERFMEEFLRDFESHCRLLLGK